MKNVQVADHGDDVADQDDDVAEEALGGVEEKEHDGVPEYALRIVAHDDSEDEHASGQPGVEADSTLGTDQLLEDLDPHVLFPGHEVDDESVPDAAEDQDEAVDDG